jgi:predicted nucleic acid-binding Zn ribbon protein
MAEPTVSDTKYCQECGSEINRKAEICPDCGVRQGEVQENDDRSQRASQFLKAGLALGVCAIIILPIVFGPLAMLCGVLAMFYGRPLAGAGVAAWGFVGAGIGWILGTIGLALL